MRLIDVRYNEDINYSPFIDEFDRFEEFDIEVMSKDYDYRIPPKNKIKDIDEMK